MKEEIRRLTMQMFQDQGLFGNYDNEDEALRRYPFIQRCTPDLEKLFDDVIE